MMCNGQRTMRTCLEGAARLGAADLAPQDFAGAKWAFFSGYSLYSVGLLPHAVALAAQVQRPLVLFWFSCTVLPCLLGVEPAL